MKRSMLGAAVAAGFLLLSPTGAWAQGKGALMNQRLGPPVPFEGTAGPYCSNPVAAIPDNDPTGVSDTLSIPDNFTLLDLDVSIGVPHSWVGDLIFTLTHTDTGTTVVFIDRPGVPASTFGCSGDDIAARIDDDATLPVENECAAAVPTINGTFYGGDPPNSTLLSAFNGESINGTWVLTVSDNAGGDTGTLNVWCLITDPVPVELLGIGIE